MNEEYTLEELYEINREAIKKERPDLDEETLHDEACDAALNQHLDQELAKKDS